MANKVGTKFRFEYLKVVDARTKDIVFGYLRTLGYVTPIEVTSICIIYYFCKHLASICLTGNRGLVLESNFEKIDYFSKTICCGWIWIKPTNKNEYKWNIQVETNNIYKANISIYSNISKLQIANQDVVGIELDLQMRNVYTYYNDEYTGIVFNNIKIEKNVSYLLAAYLSKSSRSNNKETLAITVVFG
eukprot:116966_1